MQQSHAQALSQTPLRGTAPPPPTPYVGLAAKLGHSFTAYAERPCVAERLAADAPFRWYSYGEVGALSRRLGRGLRTLCAAGGDACVVVAIFRKRDRWWYLYDFGAQLAGLVTIGLDNCASHDALAGVCRMVRPGCVVVDADTAGPMRRICAELKASSSGYLPRIIYADDDAGAAVDETDTEALLATDGDGGEMHFDRERDALATLICTSGSSGHPKAVMLSDEVWSRRVYQPRPGSGPFATDCGGSKLWVSFQPPFHTMDRKSVWECVFVGGKIGIHQDAHGKEALWADFQELQPDRIVASPAFWKQLQLDWEMGGGTAEASAALLKRLGGRVHTGNVSGAKPSEALIAFMRDQLGFQKRPGNNYSSSEAHLVLSNGLADARNGVRVKLADVPGMYSVAEQGAGELLVSSPSLFSGYFGNAEATASALVYDEQDVAWYRTGDVARIVPTSDTTGKPATYDIVDRVSSVVKMASGEFVNPSAVEAKLSAVCAELCQEVVVDARAGEERIAAIVVPKPQHAALSREELLAALNAKISSASAALDSCEMVRGLVVVPVSEFAAWRSGGLMTPLGKFVRGAIAARYAPQLDALYCPEFQFAAECRARMECEDVRAQLVGMLAFMLEADPASVEQHHGHLGSLGLNSLGAARLTSTLKQERFNSRAVSSAMVINMDLDGLVECVRTGDVVLHAQDQLLTEMEADSRIPGHLRKAIAEQSPKGTLRCVFVTGGTGVLGSAVISDILCHVPSVETVLCLVRADSAERGRARLVPAICSAMGVESLPCRLAGRVVAVLGQLEEDGLGMGQDAWAQLTQRVDCVIHSAALVNHVLPYSGHREANVSGTRRILELAAAGGAAVHFVSTSSVVLASKPAKPIVEGEPPCMSPMAANLNGYAQSKLVSELLCRDAAAAGLPVAIYRPGIISGHSTNGYCKPDDFYPRLLQAIASRGIYPAVCPDATFDMTPLDWVARGVTHLALTETAAEMVTSGVPMAERVYHTIAKDSHEVRFQTLVDGVRAHSADAKEVEYATFVEAMESEERFAPLLHELRPAGRTSVRWLDTAAFERAVRTAVPPMPPSGITAHVVASCLAFCAKCPFHSSRG